MSDFRDRKTSAIQKIITSRIRSAMGDLRGETAPVGHKATIGSLREQRIRQLVKSFIPREVEVTSGFVCDVVGGVSPQIDILICEKDIFPFLELDDQVSLAPVEKALVCLEIKSVLDKSALEQIQNQIDSIQSFPRTDKSELPVFHGVIALEASNPMEDQCLSMMNSNPQFRFATVVGQWAFINRAWDKIIIKRVPATQDYLELRHSIGSLMHVIGDAIDHKRRDPDGLEKSKRIGWGAYLDDREQNSEQ